MYFDVMNTHTTTSDFSFVLCMSLFMDIAIVIYRKKIPSLCSYISPILIRIISRLAQNERLINELPVFLVRDESSLEFGSLSPLYSQQL